MHRSGVGVSRELSQQFSSLNGSSVALPTFLSVTIEDEKFCVQNSAPATRPAREVADREVYQQALEACIQPSSPCIILFKPSTSSPVTSLWCLIAYTPDDAVVKDKMLFASSRAQLKASLGAALFHATDLAASNREELSWNAFVAAFSSSSTQASRFDASRVQLMSKDEQDRLHVTSGVSTRLVRSSAMAKLSMPCDDSVQEHLSKAISTWSSMNSASRLGLLFKLEKTTETLMSETITFKSLDECASSLPSSEPRYLVLPPNPDVLFVYYCPEDAPRRLKMTYSTLKRNVLEMLQETLADTKWKDLKRMEVTEQSELTASNVEQAMRPPAATSATSSGFSRPARRGRGIARLTKNV